MFSYQNSKKLKKSEIQGLTNEVSGGKLFTNLTD